MITIGLSKCVLDSIPRIASSKAGRRICDIVETSTDRYGMVFMARTIQRSYLDYSVEAYLNEGEQRLRFISYFPKEIAQ